MASKSSKSSKSTAVTTKSGQKKVVRKGSVAEAKYKSQGASFNDSRSAIDANRTTLRTERAARAASSSSGRTASGRDYTISSNPAITERNRLAAEGIDAKRGSMPSPYQTEVSTGNADTNATYEEAQKNLSTGGLQGNALTQAQTALAGKYGVTGGAQAAPVATPAAAPTPTQNRYQQGLAAAQSAGLEAPADAGVARATASSYLPAEAQDTSVVDNIFSQDPAINTLMAGIGDLLSSKNQVPSIMDDYRRLRRQSGLDDINEELIDAETILDGTEDDIRNEIQTAGGFGTESQVQAMTLSRNKNLLKRYNQLVQMKTDATNQLNTMLTLTQQDRQMAQERVNTQISAMFNMANFRQTALQNTRQQQQFMIQTMGADGYYATVSQDPRQLAMAEQIMGVAPGGLQAVAAQATAEKQRKAAIEERQIRATESNAAAGWANVALARDRLAFEKGESVAKAQARIQGQVTQADIVLGKVGEAQKLIAGGWSGGVSTGAVGALLGRVPSSNAYNLKQAIVTIKANLGFAELQKMRDNSPTGGALGQVAVQELNMLQSTITNLDPGQDAATVRANLRQVENHYKNYLGTLGYVVGPDGVIREITN